MLFVVSFKPFSGFPGLPGLFSGNLLRFNGQVDFPQKPGGILGRGGIDVEACPPFKSRHSGQRRHDFKMPVVILFRTLLKGRGVENEVVGRILQGDVEPSENIEENPGQGFILAFLPLVEG